jgi:hypothetical protein
MNLTILDMLPGNKLPNCQNAIFMVVRLSITAGFSALRTLVGRATRKTDA